MVEQVSTDTPAVRRPDDPSLVGKRFYFINEQVEDKLRRYLWTKCTSVVLRDSIMEHAGELITQIIRRQNLHVIYPGQEESAFGDLVQTAWLQIERTLYKFRSRPHCRACYNPERPGDSVLYNPAQDEYGIITYDELFIWLGAKALKLSTNVGDFTMTSAKITTLASRLSKRNLAKARSKGRRCPKCKAELSDEPEVLPLQGTFGGSESVLYRGSSKVFNMWSQVSRTVILAFVKKEARDRKNATSYRSHLAGTPRLNEDRMQRFLDEAREICKYNQEHLVCLEALVKLMKEDDKPHEGLVAKLVELSGLSRVQVVEFLTLIRMRSHEFSDSPLSREMSHHERPNRLQQLQGHQDEEFEG